jgi:type II secretory pathway pseudopilin PulG
VTGFNAQPNSPRGNRAPRRHLQRGRWFAGAFTLIEMLTTVALLVIVLGLMVSLARYVRNRSATQLSRELLVNLNEAMARYEKSFNGAVPTVPTLAEPGELPDEQTLLRAAEVNNRAFVAAMKPVLDGKFSASLPGTVYDGQMLRDAWGSPIVLMPSKHNAIGMAPGNRRFFFSAGPDRDYHSRQDNLYSYEMTGG